MSDHEGHASVTRVADMMNLGRGRRLGETGATREQQERDREAAGQATHAHPVNRE